MLERLEEAMAADLVDLRAKITERSNQVLEAHAIAYKMESPKSCAKRLNSGPKIRFILPL